ncbi:MAG: hypothetical protein HY436_01215, partial [Candidatus Liptonbacteria bacterium]|nr:hypothetical protein [Candidatus Liptonbacteria bacterium]
AAPRDIPTGFALGDLSPDFGKVQVVSARPRTRFAPEEITLAARLGFLEESVTVTGWRIETRRGETIRIPQATSLYRTSAIGAEEDIVLTGGARLAIYATSSPLGDFRVNKCMGYLEELFHISPPLAVGCPRVDAPATVTLSGACQEHIESLRGCDAPDLNAPGVRGDGACQEYLRTLTYSGCVERERNSRDFFRPEWRVYVDKQVLDSLHDRVLLFDERGLLVDEYHY